MLEICLATIGVCVFRCVDFGWRTFYLKEIEKMQDNDQKKRSPVVQSLGKYHGVDLGFALRIAQSEMFLLEDKLASSLDCMQFQLYKDYADIRDRFFEIASEAYERKQ